MDRLVALLLFGAVAQLEERLICIQEVVGSIPSGSTIFWWEGELNQPADLASQIKMGA